MTLATYSTNSAVDTHSVLRNTYWLLALSMLPTVFGAFLGVKFGLPEISGWGFFGVLVVLFGFIFLIHAAKDTIAGIPILLLFTFLMGLMMTPLLTKTLAYSNGATLIMTAFGGTAVIFAALASYATVTKRDFSGMGKFLFVALILLILAGIANIFLQISLLTVAFSAVAVVLFSAYILYDVQQIINGGETNYITATLSIYLDVLNIFQNLLNLLGLGFGDDD